MNSINAMNSMSAFRIGGLEMVTKEKVVELRDKTGAGIMDCKTALVEAKGDIDKAAEILRKKGASIVEKKSGRVAKEGRIESYIHHGGRIGSLIEINCETDFVARTDDFKKLSRDIAMQIAAANPHYLNKEDVPKTLVDKERRLIQEGHTNKPKDEVEKLANAELEKVYKALCLMEQPFIKDEKLTIKGYVDSVISKVGENIVVKRFARYQLGE